MFTPARQLSTDVFLFTEADFKREAPKLLGARDLSDHTLPFYLVGNKERIEWWIQMYAQTNGNDLIGHKYGSNSAETIFHWAVEQNSSTDVFKILLRNVPDLEKIKRQGESPTDIISAGARNLKLAKDDISKELHSSVTPRG